MFLSRTYYVSGIMLGAENAAMSKPGGPCLPGAHSLRGRIKRKHLVHSRGPISVPPLPPFLSLVGQCIHIVERLETSLVVQWLRLCAHNSGGLGLIPGQGTRSHWPQLRSCAAKKKKKEKRRMNQLLPSDTKTGPMSMCQAGWQIQGRVSPPILLPWQS